MAKKEPVNVNWQTLFIFPPLVWIWVFYRIDKFWQGLALMLGLGLGIGLAVGFVVGVGDAIYELEATGDIDLEKDISSEAEGLAAILAYGITSGIGVHFIRKWSREWNQKLS